MKTGRITKNEYDIKARSLKECQLEINIMSKNHEGGDDSFKMAVEGLFSIASTAYEIFESSKIEEKRQLIGFVFSNLALKGVKLEYTPRNPFPLMAGKHSYQEWSDRVNTFRTCPNLRLAIFRLSELIFVRRNNGYWDRST